MVVWFQSQSISVSPQPLNSSTQPRTGPSSHALVQVSWPAPLPVSGLPRIVAARLWSRHLQIADRSPQP